MAFSLASTFSFFLEDVFDVIWEDLFEKFVELLNLPHWLDELFLCLSHLLLIKLLTLHQLLQVLCSHLSEEPIQIPVFFQHLYRLLRRYLLQRVLFIRHKLFLDKVSFLLIGLGSRNFLVLVISAALLFRWELTALVEYQKLWHLFVSLVGRRLCLLLIFAGFSQRSQALLNVSRWSLWHFRRAINKVNIYISFSWLEGGQVSLFRQSFLFIDIITLANDLREVQVYPFFMRHPFFLGALILLQFRAIPKVKRALVVWMVQIVLSQIAVAEHLVELLSPLFFLEVIVQFWLLRVQRVLSRGELAGRG